MTTKICPVCKKDFVRTSNRQIYCSKECNRSSDKYQRSKKGYEQSDKGMETKKKYAKKRKIIQKIKICLHCNTEFVPLKGHKNYCSKECYQKSDRYKELDKKRNQKPKRIEDRKKQAQKFESKQQQLEYQRSDKYKAYYRKRQKERRKIDVVWRLKTNMRARLGAFIKASNIKKTNTTFKMVGCTPEFLKEYLEKLFKPGMTWKNHSLKGWHVDHIKALDKAKTPEDVEKLMHYTNLQPMWAVDNIKKSNK